jgi:uncharacterized HAD superfamily protein
VRQKKSHQALDSTARQRIIGFDIDGVLTDEMSGGKNIWQREIEAYFPGIQLLEPDFTFTAAFGLSLEEVDRFMEERAPEVFRKVKPQPGSRELIEYLQDAGFTVHLITARFPCYEDVTREWLASHGFRPNALWFVNAKGALCRELGVELFVDDYWENCLDVRDHGIKALLMSAPHNLGCPEEQGICRVENWEEIRAHVREYYGLSGWERGQVSGTSAL